MTTHAISTTPNDRRRSRSWSLIAAAAAASVALLVTAADGRASRPSPPNEQEWQRIGGGSSPGWCPAVGGSSLRTAIT